MQPHELMPMAEVKEKLLDDTRWPTNTFARFARRLAGELGERHDAENFVIACELALKDPEYEFDDADEIKIKTELLKAADAFFPPAYAAEVKRTLRETCPFLPRR